MRPFPCHRGSPQPLVCSTDHGGAPSPGRGGRPSACNPKRSALGPADPSGTTDLPDPGTPARDDTGGGEVSQETVRAPPSPREGRGRTHADPSSTSAQRAKERAMMRLISAVMAVALLVSVAPV